jgi:hypothetical protein
MSPDSGMTGFDRPADDGSRFPRERLAIGVALVILAMIAIAIVAVVNWAV